MTEFDFKKIAVFGIGLLGGSVCRGLRNYSKDIELHAYGRNPDKLKRVLDDGIINCTGDIKKPDLKGIDLIIVCLPVIVSIDAINNLLNDPELGENTLVIDVGSVKEAILNSVEKNKSAGKFIGCHPMAGSERDGYENSREGLFRDASVIITPNRFNSRQDIDRVIGFWNVLKARTVVCQPDIHDVIISFTSHIPHLLACLVVDNFFGICKDDFCENIIRDKPDLFIGQGFKDITRIASGSPDIWADISVLNKDNIVKSIDLMTEKLRFIKTKLNSGNNVRDEMKLFFKKIKEYKLTLGS